MKINRTKITVSVLITVASLLLPFRVTAGNEIHFGYPFGYLTIFKSTFESVNIGWQSTVLKLIGINLFNFCLDFIRGDAERPTGAFPSSHIGNSTLVIIMLLAKREYKLALILSPVYVLLVFSTVYLGAHYVIDVIAGFISAFTFFGLSLYLYPLFSGRNHTDFKL